MSPFEPAAGSRVWRDCNSQSAKATLTILRQHPVQLGVRKGSVARILLDFDTMADEFWGCASRHA
jgi:hypothetical protein